MYLPGQSELAQLFVENIFGILFGSVVTLITTRLTILAGVLHKRRSLLNLCGDWLEIIPSLKNERRQYSIGSFYFDRISNTFRYDGINYLIENNSCRPYYKWECKVLHGAIEEVPKQILYIYKVSQHNSSTLEKYGFGVTNLDILNEVCTFRNGFFIDANDKPRIREHRLQRLKTLEREFSINRSDFDNVDAFHRSIVSRYHAKHGARING
jgi:hypothetical protein